MGDHYAQAEGKVYHMQELGFFSWYFNKLGVVSPGAGGKLSSNGTFQRTSKACPPGSTNYSHLNRLAARSLRRQAAELIVEYR